MPPRPAFETNLSPEERRAIDWARANFAELYAHAGRHIDTRIQQLLPFSLPAITRWGSSALARQGALVDTVARLQRDLSTLDPIGLTDEMVRAARPASSQGRRGLLARAGAAIDAAFASPGKSLAAASSSYRRRITAVRSGLLVIQAQVEQAREAWSSAGSRLPVQLAALAAAASATGTPSDAALALAIDNRRRVLQQATTQRQALHDQIEEMRRHIVDCLDRIEQVVTVTLPAIEAARATNGN